MFVIKVTIVQTSPNKDNRILIIVIRGSPLIVRKNVVGMVLYVKQGLVLTKQQLME